MIEISSNTFKRFRDGMLMALRQSLSGQSNVTVPAGGGLIWGWFIELSSARSWHMNGPNPITFIEIEAFSRLNLWDLKPHHISLIKAMDVVYIEHCLAAHKKGGNPNTASTKPSGKISAALFDAVFG